MQTQSEKSLNFPPIELLCIFCYALGCWLLASLLLGGWFLGACARHQAPLEFLQESFGWEECHALLTCLIPIENRKNQHV